MLELLTHLGASLGPWLYVLVAVLAFGESALLLGMFVPGETALLIAGYYCHQGVISLAVLIPLAVVAAMLGDSVGFETGRRFGPQIRVSRLGLRVGDRGWSAVDAFLHRNGGRAILLARMTAMLRALTPTVAGMTGMRYRTFLIWNIVGGTIWGAGCVFLGWAFGSALTQVRHYLTWGRLVMALLALAFWLIKRYRRRTDPTHLREDSPALRGSRV